MGNNLKEIVINILTVIIGIITALLIFLPLITLLFPLVGLIPFGDDKTANLVISIIMMIAVSVSSSIGGYITGLFSERNYLIYSCITGIVLIIVYISASDFRINNEIFSIISLIMILPSTLFGGYLANRKNSTA